MANSKSAEDEMEPTGRGPEMLRLRIGFERALHRAQVAEAALERVRGVLSMARKLTPEVMALCDELARALAKE